MATGVILIGDAASWSDPIIGQGLSVALRDARSVGDVLLASDDWHPHAFRGYVEERSERMRRLRIAAFLYTETRCTFSEQGRERRRRYFERQLDDARMFGLVQAVLSGPESAPAETFTDGNIQRVLMLA
jgi:2-polyprenyl-6-methoxyphenol hydroxylase-like FAD-dependent oxidoreductase